jgi:hypothetical protein
LDRVDLIAGVGLTVAGLLMIFVVIPLGTREGMYYGLSPTFFPTLLATCMTACAVGMTVQAWRRLRVRADPSPPPISRWNLLMFLASAALVLAGVMVIDAFGIIAGGPVLIVGFMLFLGERSVVRIALTATLPVAAVYFLAIYVLKSPLP